MIRITFWFFELLPFFSKFNNLTFFPFFQEKLKLLTLNWNIFFMAIESQFWEDTPERPCNSEHFLFGTQKLKKIPWIWKKQMKNNNWRLSFLRKKEEKNEHRTNITFFMAMKSPFWVDTPERSCNSEHFLFWTQKLKKIPWIKKKQMKQIFVSQNSLKL